MHVRTTPILRSISVLSACTRVRACLILTRGPAIVCRDKVTVTVDLSHVEAYEWVLEVADCRCAVQWAATKGSWLAACFGR